MFYFLKFGDDGLVISTPLPSLLKRENNSDENCRKKKSPSSLIKLRFPDQIIRTT